MNVSVYLLLSGVYYYGEDDGFGYRAVHIVRVGWIVYIRGAGGRGGGEQGKGRKEKEKKKKKETNHTASPLRWKKKIKIKKNHRNNDPKNQQSSTLRCHETFKPRWIEFGLAVGLGWVSSSVAMTLIGSLGLVVVYSLICSLLRLEGREGERERGEISMDREVAIAGVRSFEHSSQGRVWTHGQKEGIGTEIGSRREFLDCSRAVTVGRRVGCWGRMMMELAW